MDRFLNEQKTGRVVDTHNPFTVDKARSRDKLLDSIPHGDSHSLYRQIDAAVSQLGARPSSVVHEVSSDHGSGLYVDLKMLEPNLVNAFLEELRRPFGEPSGVSHLARATFRGTRLYSSVDIYLGNGLVTWLKRDARLSTKDLEISPKLTAQKAGLRVMFLGANPGYREHRASGSRKLYSLLNSPERLLPLESISREVSGYFDYRTRPFTAIRSYVCLEPEEQGTCMYLDLWKGPYELTDTQTALLEQKEPGKFLFLTWRPNYGNPTFVHHFLNSPLSFKVHRVKATFWVETTDRPCQVYFYSQGMLSDPVLLPGPPGLTGIVIWPSLKFDLWGTQLVKDSSYDEAVSWAQSQVKTTADCLKEHLETVVERLKGSNLIKSAYLKETIQKIRLYWG